MSDISDSLAATRSRRPNAGSRLKQLLALEETPQSQTISEDDQHVNLLFQEEADDVSFDEEDENSDEDEDEEEDGENDDENGPKTNENGPETDENALDDEETAAAVNSDDVLSDSDLSASDSDESEGEKELQTQEKAKKRKSKKALRVIPAIKRPKLDEPKKPKKARVTSESLMLSARRASSRAAVVENKHALVQRLKESEKRRALFTPVVRVKEREMTQDERLAESVLTEEANIISLNQFREQEVVKKERQRLLLLLKRVKLRNVVRSVSQATLISPLEEIEQSRHAQAIINAKLKRKPGRRRKVDIAEPVVRLPGELDTELPMVKAEMERERLKKEEAERKRDEKRRLAGIEASQNLPTTAIDVLQKDTEKAAAENIKKEPVSQDLLNVPEEKPEESDGGNGPNKASDQITEITSDKEDEVVTENGTPGSLEAKPVEEYDNGQIDAPVEPQSSSGPSEENTTLEASPDIPLSEAESSAVSNTSEKDPASQTNDIEAETKGPTEEETGPSSSLSQESPAPEEQKEQEDKIPEAVPSDQPKSEKKVSFAVEDSPVAADIPEVETKPVTRSSSGEIFEGPAQLVARNTLYFIDFEEHLLSEYNLKLHLFGPEANTPASHRFRDVRTIMRIGQVTNPYAVVKEERDPLFEPVSELTEEDTMFDELKKLPRLGVAQVYEVEDDDNDDDDSMAIHLKTEAPAGLYLPNGNKKNCTISGKEVRYFDPSNGMPYGSVDTFKVLKAVETGGYQWLSFEHSFNSYGGADLYLTPRELARHAKGVPEGFAE